MSRISSSSTSDISSGTGMSRRVDKNFQLIPLFEPFTKLLPTQGMNVQMAEWYKASASGSVDLRFDSESGQTNDLKIGIYSFPA